MERKVNKRMYGPAVLARHTRTGRIWATTRRAKEDTNLRSNDHGAQAPDAAPPTGHQDVQEGAVGLPVASRRLARHGR